MAESRASQAQVQDPWAPIVLSLDGGGVRGLSSLYILREIMKQIKQLDDNRLVEDRLEQGSNGQLPLPCHYFDFIIGVSTGGLIAIMLGRLRMGVNDCIQQYWVLSNAIFRPPRQRFLQLYSRKKVQDAAKEVVKKFCTCHHAGFDVCSGRELLRQYDYDEEGVAASNISVANKTCRVAVLTVREGGHTTFEPGRSDVPILFRSYNHRVRHHPHKSERATKEMNPRTLENSNLMIHEACSATSAAPTYFRSVVLWGRKFIDGGVQANNPSVIAWNEAGHMANLPSGQVPELQMRRTPYALVSIGTGMSKKHDRFSLRSFIRFMTKNITDTSTAHEIARQLPADGRYFRFDVPDRPRNFSHMGLADVKLTACEKHHKIPWYNRPANKALRWSVAIASSAPNGTAALNTPPALVGPPMNSQTLTSVQLAAIEEDQCLQHDAEETRKGGYKPSKYHYKTYNDIRDRTIAYCHSVEENSLEIRRLIVQCATILYEHSLRRRDLEGRAGARSLREFRRQPCPHCPGTDN